MGDISSQGWAIMPRKVELPTPEQYGEFIQGLELRRVRLIESHIEALESIPDPAKSQIHLEESYTFMPKDSGFEAIGSFKLIALLQKTKVEQGSLEVRFGFTYNSKLAPSDVGFDGYFNIFKDVNLPINMWPFVREYIYNSMSRMDWPPFTLPLRKVSPQQPPQARKARTRASKNKS